MFFSRDFVAFSDAVYGNCYVYNADWNDSSPNAFSKKPGIKNGICSQLLVFYTTSKRKY